MAGRVHELDLHVDVLRAFDVLLLLRSSAVRGDTLELVR